MKNTISAILPLAIVISATSAHAQFQIKEQGSDYTVWTAAPRMKSAEFGTNHATAASFVELETGKRYLDEQGQWQDSVEEVTLSKDGGAVAERLPYKVHFGPTLETPVKVLTSDGKTLQFRPVGLAFQDYIAKKYAMFAETAYDSAGELISSNQVLYPDVIQGGGWSASIRYTVRKAGIEQDVIINRVGTEALPERFKFNPNSTRMLALTEFVSPPEGVRTTKQVRRGWKKATVDRLIDFGKMKIGNGAVFMLGDEEGSRAPTEKHWQVIDGRTVLMEEISFRKITPMLSRLQANASAPAKRTARLAASSPTTNLCLPRVSLAKAKASSSQKLLASASPQKPGVVIDFNLQSATGLTLQADETYLVTGIVNLTNAILEGTVIKFNRGAQLHFYTPPICRTGPYRPAVFTAVDDNSIGVDVGGTGTPTGRYAETALFLHAGGDLKNLRILHAKEAVYSASSSFSISHSQILHTDCGLRADNTSVSCYNILMGKTLTNFYGSYFTVMAQHLTSDSANIFVWDPNFGYDEWCQGLPSGLVEVENSIIAGLTNGYGYVPVYRSHTHEYANSDQVFTSAAGGHYYLLPDSPSRNAGKTNLDAWVLADLKERTVNAPQLFIGGSVSTPSTFGPVAQRDKDIPDLGYHYDPLDYVFAGVNAQENMTFLPGTAVGWYRTTSGWESAGHGIHLTDQKTLTFDGLAEAPCHWVRVNTVQEEDLTAGFGPGGITGSAWPNIQDAPQVVARFTRFCAMSDSAHFRDDYGWLVVRAKDCELWGGTGAGYNNRQYFTNCLFARTMLGFCTDWPDSAFAMANCTMIGGMLNPYRFGSGASAPVTITDSAFDGTQFQNTAGGSAAYDFNAFLTAGPRVTPTGLNDVLVDTFNWQVAVSGDYYLSTNSPLVDVGSVPNAGSIGMYHYTAQTNQVKEANTRIDIGYHHVALGSNGAFADSDGDTLFDYWEDRDGDGVYSSTVDLASWLSADTDNDAATDPVELMQGRNPRIAGTQDDTTGTVIGLKIYSILK